MLWSPLLYILLTPVAFGSNTEVGNTLVSPRTVPWRKKTLTGFEFLALIAFSLPQGVQLLKYKLLLVLQLHEAALKAADFGTPWLGYQVEILTRAGLQN